MSFSKDCDLSLTFKLTCNHNSDTGNRFLALKLAQNEVLHIFLCLLLQKLQLIRVYGGHFGFMLTRKNAFYNRDVIMITDIIDENVEPK